MKSLPFCLKVSSVSGLITGPNVPKRTPKNTLLKKITLQSSSAIQVSKWSFSFEPVHVSRKKDDVTDLFDQWLCRKVLSKFWRKKEKAMTLGVNFSTFWWKLLQASNWENSNTFCAIPSMTGIDQPSWKPKTQPHGRNASSQILLPFFSLAHFFHQFNTVKWGCAHLHQFSCCF